MQALSNQANKWRNCCMKNHSKGRCSWAETSRRIYNPVQESTSQVVSLRMLFLNIPILEPTLTFSITNTICDLQSSRITPRNGWNPILALLSQVSLAYFHICFLKYSNHIILISFQAFHWLCLVHLNTISCVSQTSLMGTEGWLTTSLL